MHPENRITPILKMVPSNQRQVRCTSLFATNLTKESVSEPLTTVEPHALCAAAPPQNYNPPPLTPDGPVSRATGRNPPPNKMQPHRGQMCLSHPRAPPPDNESRKTHAGLADENRSRQRAQWRDA